MNEAFTLIPESFASILGSTIMHSLWQLSLVALVLLFLLMFLPASRARLRYGLSLGAMFLMVALPVITFVNESKITREATTVNSMALADATVKEPAILNVIPKEAVTSWQSFTDQVSVFFQTHDHWVAAFWIMGAVFFCLRFLGAFWFIQRLKGRWSQSVAGTTYQAMEKLRHRMQISKPVRLLESARISTPMVMGVLQPVILLPAGMATGLSERELEYILMHELAHIVRKDFLINLFQSIAEILFFYHPGIWVVSRIAREERENCVDQMVVNLSGEKKGYAQALLTLETLRGSKSPLAPAASGGQLFKRIKNIMGIKQKRTGYSIGIAAILIGVIITLLLATGLGENLKAAVFSGDGDPDQVEENDSTEQQNENKDGSIFKLATTNKHQSEDLFQNVKLKSVVHAVDTPKMVITLLDNGEEVKVVYNENGKVEMVTVNGKTVGDDQFDHYDRMATNSYDKYAAGNNKTAIPAPPAPPKPSDINGNPFAALGEGLGEMMVGLTGMLNEMPIFDESGQFSRSMGELGSHLQYLTENVKDGEEPDPEKMAEFERRMEEWGERFENGFGKDMEAWGEKMEAWGEQFEKDFEGKFDEKEMEAWARQFEGDGKKWEEFGEKMEAWGEAFEQKMEAQAREMERKAEQAARKADNEETRKIERTLDRVEERLMVDGLIKSSKSYSLKVNKRGMWVDGEKMPDEIHERYVDFLERVMGKTIKDIDNFEINKNN